MYVKCALKLSRGTFAALFSDKLFAPFARIRDAYYEYDWLISFVFIYTMTTQFINPHSYIKITDQDYLIALYLITTRNSLKTILNTFWNKTYWRLCYCFIAILVFKKYFYYKLFCIFVSQVKAKLFRFRLHAILNRIPVILRPLRLHQS